MSKLTEKTHWDGVHAGESHRLFRTRTNAYASAVQTVKRLIGSETLQKMSGYDDYLLWDVILPKYVPRLNGAKAVEIGSAPGEYIVRFGKNHDCEPHGIEYSE